MKICFENLKVAIICLTKKEIAPCTRLDSRDLYSIDDKNAAQKVAKIKTLIEKQL